MCIHGSINVAPSMAASALHGPSAAVPFTLVLAAFVRTVALALVAVYGRESLADGERVTAVGPGTRSDSAHAPGATAGAVED